MMSSGVLEEEEDEDERLNSTFDHGLPVGVLESEELASLRRKSGSVILLRVVQQLCS